MRFGRTHGLPAIVAGSAAWTPAALADGLGGLQERWVIALIGGGIYLAMVAGTIVLIHWWRRRAA